MFCPGCGAANVEGAKFCGACGVRIEAVAPTAVAPGPGPAPSSLADATSATVVRAPRAFEPSAASLSAPRSGGRGKLLAVLALDAGLVVAGLVLATRPGAPAAAAKAPTEVATGDGTPTPSDGTGSGTGSSTRPTGSGGTGGGSAVRPSTGSSGGSGSSAGTGSGTGTGSTSGSVDARSLDDLFPDAAVAAPPAIDAGGDPVVTPIADAAVAAVDPTDAAAPADELDAGADEELSVAQLQAQFTRLAVGSDSRFARCYQSATKALPDDQPLRGEVDIELAVMPTGQTENVRVDRNTTGSQTLADCVIGVARSWTFSRHSATESLQFKRTLNFGPSGEAGR